MTWIKNFYEKQFLMLDQMYSMNESDQLALLSKIEGLAGRSFNSLLELGAGSGGFAVTAATKGYKVTAVELVPALVEEAIHKKDNMNHSVDLTVIEGDFNEISLHDQFDVICYLDGFGVGEDSDQIQLLNRISHWLKPNGCALIDIYSPWYWSKAAGQEMRLGNTERKYDFNFKENIESNIIANQKLGIEIAI